MTTKQSTEYKGLNLFSEELDRQISQQIADKINKEIGDIKTLMPMIIVKGKEEYQTPAGLKHCKLNKLIEMVGLDLNVIMVGMAGTGKTKATEQVAEALKLDFYCQSVGSQTSKSDLLGYMDANGKYVSTAFRQAYEKGGVFTMDEIDAGNSNVLIVLNSALSNGICSFPDKMVKRHKDFRFVATANTYGNGANRVYVGRNQLDGATLDRFATIDWEVDEKLEKALVKNHFQGEPWAKAVQKLRAFVNNNSIRAIVSPRMTIKGASLLSLGWTIDEVIESVVLPQVPADKHSLIISEIKSQYKPLTAEPEKADSYELKF